MDFDSLIIDLKSRFKIIEQNNPNEDHYTIPSTK